MCIVDTDHITDVLTVYSLIRLIVPFALCHDSSIEIILAIEQPRAGPSGPAPSAPGSRGAPPPPPGSRAPPPPPR